MLTSLPPACQVNRRSNKVVHSIVAFVASRKRLRRSFVLLMICNHPCIQTWTPSQFALFLIDRIDLIEMFDLDLTFFNAQFLRVWPLQWQVRCIRISKDNRMHRICEFWWRTCKHWMSIIVMMIIWEVIQKKRIRVSIQLDNTLHKRIDRKHPIRPMYRVIQRWNYGCSNSFLF